MSAIPLKMDDLIVMDGYTWVIAEAQPERDFFILIRRRPIMPATGSAHEYTVPKPLLNRLVQQGEAAHYRRVERTPAAAPRGQR